MRVARQARSPVAVIPWQPDRDPDQRTDGPILLGVDGSANCQAAIGYAFDEAAIIGAPSCPPCTSGTGTTWRPRASCTGQRSPGGTTTIPCSPNNSPDGGRNT